MRPLYAAAVALAAALPAAAQDVALSQILIDGEGWKPFAKGLPGVTRMEARADGRVMLQSPAGEGHLADDGTFVRWDRRPPLPLRGVVRGDWRYSVVQNKVQRLSAAGERHAEKTDGVKEPTGLVLWPDGTTLVVGDAGGKHLWAYRLAKDGSLADGDRYYPLRMKPGETASKVTSLTVDTAGRLYALTPAGVQVFDPTGRLVGVLLPPGAGEMTACCFGGADRSLLFVACGDTVYARRLKAQGPAPAGGGGK